MTLHLPELIYSDSVIPIKSKPNCTRVVLTKVRFILSFTAGTPKYTNGKCCYRACQKRTHHIVGIRFDSASPDPGVLLPNGAEANTIFGVEGGLLVRAAHDNIFALGEVTDTAGIIIQDAVLSNLQANVYYMLFLENLSTTS